MCLILRKKGERCGMSVSAASCHSDYFASFLKSASVSVSASRAEMPPCGKSLGCDRNLPTAWLWPWLGSCSRPNRLSAACHSGRIPAKPSLAFRTKILGIRRSSVPICCNETAFVAVHSVPSFGPRMSIEVMKWTCAASCALHFAPEDLRFPSPALTVVLPTLPELCAVRLTSVLCFFCCFLDFAAP